MGRGHAEKQLSHDEPVTAEEFKVKIQDHLESNDFKMDEFHAIRGSLQVENIDPESLAVSKWKNRY